MKRAEPANPAPEGLRKRASGGGGRGAGLGRSGTGPALMLPSPRKPPTSRSSSNSSSGDGKLVSFAQKGPRFAQGQHDDERLVLDREGGKGNLAIGAGKGTGAFGFARAADKAAGCDLRGALVPEWLRTQAKARGAIFGEEERWKEEDRVGGDGGAHLVLEVAKARDALTRPKPSPLDAWKPS